MFNHPSSLHYTVTAESFRLHFISVFFPTSRDGYAQTGMSHENTQKHTKKILPINMKSNKNNFCVILWLISLHFVTHRQEAVASRGHNKTHLEKQPN